MITDMHWGDTKQISKKKTHNTLINNQTNFFKLFFKIVSFSRLTLTVMAILTTRSSSE